MRVDVGERIRLLGDDALEAGEPADELGQGGRPAFVAAKQHYVRDGLVGRSAGVVESIQIRQPVAAPLASALILPLETQH